MILKEQSRSSSSGDHDGAVDHMLLPIANNNSGKLVIHYIPLTTVHDHHSNKGKISNKNEIKMTEFKVTAQSMSKRKKKRCEQKKNKKKRSHGCI